ncbi:glutaminyl-peptide cyclotransferase [uncultured Kriegella sp.]|mgnify:CR=1 FL=1|uniref:glutaminyl-peptide cyclotransferase n=1 Tax=uncultured Kriegella sp. TaxID=1798910 RepID=UPI0030DA674B|tara:strand:+ start:328464 stop:329504 length:1041 start_codon:yes stop_codon:yes gene_type:complete
MNTFKHLIFGSLLILFMACGGNKDAASFFTIQLEGNKTQFQQNETITIGLGNKKNKVINKVEYAIDGKKLPVTNDKVQLNMPQLGNKILTAKVDYEETSVEVSEKIQILAATAPEIYTYEIIKVYPHDINAYTQGLEFHNDTLYESTGKKGKSSLRKVDYNTGKVLQQIDLDNTFFGEGITILNNKIYMLTWRSKIGFIYDLKNLEKLDNFQYGESKEGWGLANDGTKLFKSDGTEKIWFLNPETLKEEGHIETVTNKSIFNRANELEYVDGKLYANVYQKESMMIIDAQSGAIEGVVNFGGLKNKVTQHEALDVLNGVAYHKERKTFFVTGKNWDKLFEIKILKK